MTSRWTRPALADLDAQLEWIAQFDLDAAIRTAERIEEAVSHLAAHPAMGRRGRVPGTRELVVSGTPYVVPYRVRDDVVEILALFHASRAP